MKRFRQTLTVVSRAFAIACFSFFILPGWLQAEGKISWELTEIAGEKYVAVEQIQKFYGFTQSVREGSAITLEHQRISMKLEIGSTESLINGVKVIFSRLVVERGNSVYISSVDLAQLLDPMLRPNHIEGAGDFNTVILDPAPGREFTLKIANLAKAQLVAKGFEVVLTRGDEIQEVTPEERLNFANAVEESAIFVGISFDSGAAVEPGIRTFSEARGEQVVESDPFGFASVALATSIHGSMIRRLGKNTTDRGITRGEPGVFSGIKHPAVLVNAGSISHPLDSRLVAHEGYQAAVARGIVEGLEKYRFAVSRKPQVKSEAAPELE